MSERYIFNKKLNRTNPRWYWLLGSVLLVCALSAKSQQAAPLTLVNPDAKSASAFASELQDIEFKRMANGGAQTILSFNNNNFQLQLSETKNKLVLLLPATKLAEEQLYKLDVVDFATPVSMLETFNKKPAVK